jgi:hypothetical protein
MSRPRQQAGQTKKTIKIFNPLSERGFSIGTPVIGLGLI